ncbi:hypothetical protein T484DRAFT_1921398 [Baffinella frigidus]|nr:hypothetical protein T484DRAFT_1921398 [Cryptophyta sp. CCMP2293]
MNNCDEILCRTVADCDELLDCLDDMRRIDASSSSPAPARIDDFEIRLQRERAMYAEHRDPSLTGTNVQPDFDVEWEHLDSPRVIWFDAEAVAAAADSLTGSRSGVALAMKNSMCSKRRGKSV